MPLRGALRFFASLNKQHTTPWTLFRYTQEYINAYFPPISQEGLSSWKHIKLALGLDEQAPGIELIKRMGKFSPGGWFNGRFNAFRNKIISHQGTVFEALYNRLADYFMYGTYIGPLIDDAGHSVLSLDSLDLESFVFGGRVRNFFEPSDATRKISDKSCIELFHESTRCVMTCREMTFTTKRDNIIIKADEWRGTIESSPTSNGEIREYLKQSFDLKDEDPLNISETYEQIYESLRVGLDPTVRYDTVSLSPQYGLRVTMDTLAKFFGMHGDYSLGPVKWIDVEILAGGKKSQVSWLIPKNMGQLEFVAIITECNNKRRANPPPEPIPRWIEKWDQEDDLSE